MNKRAAFAMTLTRLLGEDNALALLLGDIGTFSFRDAFAAHPSRVYNIGICESASVGIAAGLSMSGLYPVFSTIESFLLRRAYEFIYLDFGIQKLAGLFVGIGGEREYAKLGPTHQCPDGRTLVSLIPGLKFYDPDDDCAVEQVITAAVSNRELAYIRLEERA